MGKRETRKQKTEERIVAVSLELFRERGFREATMRDVAARAGIALGTIYNYFPTKEHIALHFFERALDRVLERFRQRREETASLDEEAFLLISLQIEELEPFRDFLALVVAQAAVPSSRLNPFSLEVRRLRNRYLDLAGELVADARDRGELPAAAVAGFEEMLLSAFWIYQLGILLFWLNDESPQREDTVVLLDRSVRFILDALRQGGADDAPEPG